MFSNFRIISFESKVWD